MIELVVFDLDGVLVDARELHYEAMNMALSFCGYQEISRDEHLSTYDGLPTSKKLSMLTGAGRVRIEDHQKIWEEKQRMTRVLIDRMGVDERMVRLLAKLKKQGKKVYVASNSVRETIKMMLLRRGLMEHVDFFFSNQDVTNPKPNPEIYLRSMIHAGVSPKETLVVEDSHVGRKAAVESGAHLCAVSDPSDVTEEKVFEAIDKATEKNQKVFKPKWQGGKMKVLIPMAGAGTRFAKAGYTFPKPLIMVNEKPMIQQVVENLNVEAEHIFVVQKEHLEQYNLASMLKLISPGCKIVEAEGAPGAAYHALLAKEFINNDEPLLFANSDQFLEWDSNTFLYSMMADEVDGGMATFEATHPKWSFAELGEDGFVKRVAEKDPISNIATTGIYYWKKGSDFVKYAEQMIAKDKRVNGEFYVCPVFNEAIEDGKKIKTFDIDRMWGLGTPEDLKYFLEHFDG